MNPVWTKLSKQGLITTKQSSTPHDGVWIQSERVFYPSDSQHSIERIALNGNILHSLHCYCGQHRSAALKLAQSYAKANMSNFGASFYTSVLTGKPIDPSTL